MTQKQQTPELYIVACMSLHRSFGPFLGLRAALEVAKQLTEKEAPDGCTYLPVPFLTTAKVITSSTVDDKVQKSEHRQPRGYL